MPIGGWNRGDCRARSCCAPPNPNGPGCIRCARRFHEEGKRFQVPNLSQRQGNLASLSSAPDRLARGEAVELGFGVMSSDVRYFIRRASEEREAALGAIHPNPRRVHLDLANAYESRARGPDAEQPVR